MQEDLHRELRFAAVCTVLLDALLWLVSVLLTGLHMAVPIGLALGSAGMYVNLLLLRRTVQRAVYHGKTRDMAGYLLRCLVASAVIALGLLSPYVSAPAAVLPFLYPKVIFGILSVRTPGTPARRSGDRKEDSEKRRDR
ncbi:MAG: hypothetical protein IJ055_10020 [Oscillospiraceae bacterium]|nr:hypothetical protein [Oscillospiraceae bacterium]